MYINVVNDDDDDEIRRWNPVENDTMFIVLRFTNDHKRKSKSYNQKKNCWYSSRDNTHTHTYSHTRTRTHKKRRKKKKKKQL